MSHTESRTICPKCQKKNLCKYYKDNVLQTRCMTADCRPEIIQPKTEFISSAELVFDYPTESYRGISSLICKFLGIKRADIDGREVISYDHNNIDGSFSLKRRYPGKVFDWVGKTDQTSMFALDKCIDFTRPLYITEGNEDCATLWELGFQATSIHNDTAAQANLELDIDTINKYPAIVLCIENDKAGKKAKTILKDLLKHKLLYEVDLSPRKDANDWIRDNDLNVKPDVNEILNRLNNPVEITPKGIVYGNQIDSEELRRPLEPGIQIISMPKLRELIPGGIFKGNLWLLGAGVSVGKSSLLRQFCVDFKHKGYKVGNIFIEEDVRVSQLNYLATECNKPIGEVHLDPTIIPKDEWDEKFQEMLNNPDLMFINEHWERTTQNLIKTIEYLANVKKYDIIMVDHITALINASGVSRGGKVHDIDWFMEEVFNVCRRTGICVFLVSHLKRVDQGLKWSEGRKPCMEDFRGSGSLEGKPDVILGLSRNLKNQGSCDILEIEILKNRWFHKLGPVDSFIYISDTGRLIHK